VCVPGRDTGEGDAIVDAPNDSNLESEARARGVIFVRFVALDDDLDASPGECWRLGVPNSFADVVAKCVDAGEEAELLDIEGYYLGRVVSDGSVEWGV
jgi:hypothetical protein